MLVLSLFIVCLAVICTAIMVLSLVLAKKMTFNREKSSPFECGFDPNCESRLPFSLRFFLITVIFLIFDVEIVIFLPFVFGSYLADLNSWFLIGTSFLLILLFGLFYEWKAGALEWTN